MEHIENAIRCLEDISPTIQGNIEAEEAINQLRSAAQILLGLSTLPPNTAARLSGSFRGQMLLLYRLSISLALDYIVAIFHFIHDKEISLSHSARQHPSSWETLLVSIFSGLLDFLEENPTDKARETIAVALYPIVCPLYFISVPGKSLSCHGELLSTVYQTLTATIDSHPRNTTKLRDNQISRKNLGLTISETKDFLALESLLDLFGSLIPSFKGGRTKRTVFIKDVFDPVIFKETGKEVHKLLEDISNPDWSFTSMKIVKLLAQNDVSFPQPFEIVNFMLNDAALSSSSFYIDKSQFLANIDKAGGIETLCVPFTIVSHISSLSKDDRVRVVLQLTKPPMVGNKVVSTPLEEISMSWNMNKSCLHGLSAALKSRQLSLGKPMRDKLSKVKPIELDFSSNKNDSRVLTQDRIQKLSQSWALTTSPTSSTKIDDKPKIETSPLVPKPLHTAPDDNGIKAKHLPSTPLVSLGRTAVPLSPNYLNGKGKTSNVQRTTKTEEEDVDSMNAAFNDELPLPANSKGRRLIISDEEDNEEKVIHRLKLKIPESTKAIEHEDAPPQFKQSRSTHNTDINVQDEERVHVHKKRAVDDVLADDMDKLRPAKRGRREQDTSSVPSSSKRKVYTRKGRHAAPILIPLPSVDSDEIHFVKPTGVSAMKAKNGNIVAKPQKITRKKQDKQVQHNHVQFKTIDRNKTTSSLVDHYHEPEDTTSQYLPTNLRSTDDTSSRVRRSERVAKSSVAAKKQEVMNQHSCKPQKAPWEDPEFQSKGLGSEIKLEDSKDVRPLKNARPVVNTDYVVVHNDTHLETISVKASPSFLYEGSKYASKPKDVKTEEVIIDLTRNDSPIHSPAAKIKVSKKEHAISTPVPFPIAEKEDLSVHAKQLANITNHAAFFDISNPVAESSIKRHRARKETPPLLIINNSPLSRVTKGANHKLKNQHTTLMTRVRENEIQNEYKSGIKFVLPGIKILSPISNKMLLPISKNLPLQDHTVLSVNRYQPTYSAFSIKQPLPLADMKGHTLVKEDPMHKIVSVIQQINEVVIHNIGNRFERVDEGLSVSQRKLLKDTANGLQEMYHESVQYFNDMVDLEEFYSARCTALYAGLHDNIKSSEQLAQHFKGIALDHGRQSLSKKIPSTLFQKLPESIAKPSLQL